jgi:hypothetical protein
MSIDEKINFVLEKLNARPWSKLETDVPEWFHQQSIEYENQEMYLIVHTLISEGLAYKLELSGTPKYHITRKGRMIKETGGWAHFINIEKSLAERRKLKDEYDLKNSIHLVRSKWVPHIISGIGLGFSLIALWVSLQKQPIELQLIEEQLKQLKQENSDPPTIIEKKDSLEVFSSDSIK